ncbi:hypothetical protein AAFF_G00131800 [Aldrovandia affinis]|uniref:Mitogen-activated protein kinase 8 interacting protein 2 n=1 Tax=Aldrovandia affinis TaxID=143900 RepID=A0AAD7RQX3_9TELE|nr:hypothetical protein AAFF_G00131800 [Aldrovandia affinis]
MTVSFLPPRPSHDISLEEFDDEDLSEITDDCGIGLNYDSDPYEKDCLILEKNEAHHAICSFQDDFQEFEMIDDDEEEEDDEDEEVDPVGPPSPSVSPLSSPTTGTLQKSRPTTLNLTNAISQDSLNNNNNSFSSWKSSWQDSLCNPPSHGHSSPSHSCLEDSAHPDGRCSAAPGTDAQSKGTPQKQTGDTGRTQSPLKPLLYDFEGNRRERPEYGIKMSAPPMEDQNMNILPSPPSPLYSPFSARCMSPQPCLSSTGSFGEHRTSSSTVAGVAPSTAAASPGATIPAADEGSQCSDTEVDHDLNSDYAKRCQSRQANDTYTVTTESESLVDPELENDITYDGTSKCLSTAPADGDTGTPLLDEELEGDFDVALMSKACYDQVCGEGESLSYVEFPPIEPCDLRFSSSRPEVDEDDAPGDHNLAIQSLPPTASNSPSSDPGIADMNGQGTEHYTVSEPTSDSLSSPGSDSDIEGELEAAFVCKLDLTSDESSSGRSSHLTNSIEEASSPTSDPEPELEQDNIVVVSVDPSPVLSQLDSVRDEPPPPIAPAQLDDGQSLMGLQSVDEAFEHVGDPDETLPPSGQCEDGLSRPLVLKIEPDHGLESFRRSFYLPVGPKLMPAVDDYDGNSEGDSDSESEDELSENSDSPWLLSNLVNKMISEGSYPISCPEDCFKRSHSISDTISPSSDLETDAVSEPSDGRSFGETSRSPSLRAGEGGRERRKISPEYRAELGSSRQSLGPCLYLSNPTHDTITPVFMDPRSSRMVSSGITHPKDSQTSHGQTPPKNTKGDGAEPNNDLSVELEGLGSRRLGESAASVKDAANTLDYLAEVKSSLTLDLPTAQTNRCFSLAYSTDNEEDSPFCHDYLDSSPPIDESVGVLPPLDVTRTHHLDESLAYDSVKYTLVVDENTTLELVSLKRCTSILSEDSESDAAPEPDQHLYFGRGGARPDENFLSSSEDSSPEADAHFSKKFLNVFVNSTSRSSSTESFGLFSCTIDGEEREQTHRAVFRFIPRHTDELELDVDDPLFVEEEEDDYWYRGYNMRTGERGIFPAYYAHLVLGQIKDIVGMKRSTVWMESFSVQFLGSVEVPYHQGNGILCAAMQKIAIARKQTVHLRPAALCDLEINPQGVKLLMSLEHEFSAADEFDRCSHFFQMKNISFCGCHPKNNCYFGFITKHPVLNRFACHVFVSQESMRRVAECVGRAFQEYYQEHLEYACPTEDIYLE